MARGKPRHRDATRDDDSFTALMPRLDTPVQARIPERKLAPEQVAEGLDAHGIAFDPWWVELEEVIGGITFGDYYERVDLGHHAHACAAARDRRHGCTGARGPARAAQARASVRLSRSYNRQA